MESDLYDLLSAWLGREIDGARREALLARLREDEAFRGEFVAEIRMLGLLKTVQWPEPRWLRLEDELGWSAADSLPRETLEDRIVHRLEEASRRRPWRRRWWLSIAAAILVAVGLVAIFWARGPQARRMAARRPYPTVDTAVGLAMVIKLDGVSWEPRIVACPAEGNVLAAGTLAFAAGRMSLSMLSGVVLDIEGPADVELIDTDRVLCRSGRVRARVPAGAEGFRVLGPSAAVVDLGTEFGVNVEKSGTLRGRVFKGKVEAALLSPVGTPERNLSLDASEADANKAFVIDGRTGQIEPIATSDDFVRASDPTAPPLTLDPRYAMAVRRSRPWGYWRFESFDGGSVANELPDRPPLAVTGPIQLSPAPGGNHWAEFRATDVPQFLTMRPAWHPPSQTGYGVEFWCLSKSIGHESLVSLVSPRDTDHHVFLMELTSRNRLTMHKPATVRLLHRCPPGWQGGDNAYSQAPYVPYRWHHIVGQVQSNRIELFLDGQLSSSLSITPDQSALPCQFVLGRLTGLPGSGLSIDRPFVGRMDEVALYDHPLTADEIRDHYRLGSGATAPR